MDRDDAESIAAVRAGDTAAYAGLMRKYQGRVFATARRYARCESEVEDIVQDVFIKAYQKLDSFRADAPFEHWLMRLAVRTCYDCLRKERRKRETAFSELNLDEVDWLEHCRVDPNPAPEQEEAARELVGKVLDRLSPAARLVITLLEIEERSVREIAALTGWSVATVKVRAFRARAEMRRILTRMASEKCVSPHGEAARHGD